MGRTMEFVVENWKRGGKEFIGRKELNRRENRVCSSHD